MGRERHEGAQVQKAQVAALPAGLEAIEAGKGRELCARWAAASPRFLVFLAEYENKIAKKLRCAEGEEGRRDLLVELYAAHRLLLDRRFALAYEAYVAGKTRGPDFSVVFKTRTPFNVEVKRLRGPGAADFGRWAYVVCDKLGQMPPSAMNVLLIGAEGGAAPEIELTRAMARLRMLAERKDDAFFVKRGLPGGKDYLRQLQRLSAVLLVAGWERVDGGEASLWVNAQAKHPVPADLAKALT